MNEKQRRRRLRRTAAVQVDACSHGSNAVAAAGAAVRSISHPLQLIDWGRIPRGRDGDEDQVSDADGAMNEVEEDSMLSAAASSPAH